MAAGLQHQNEVDTGRVREEDVLLLPQAEVTGFDAKFVQTLPGDYICPICTFAQRHPCLTDCGHGFCNACLEKVIKEGKLNCPVCREELMTSQIYPNKQNERNILNLKIICDQDTKGCDWSGELREQEAHNKTCEYVSVPCDCQCGEILKRLDMVDHKQNHCPKRKVQCTHCSAEIVFQDLEDHYSQCAKFPLSCDQACGAMVCRDKMEQHKSRRGSCSRSTLSCDFANAGCDFYGTRVELLEHYQSGMANHLDNVMMTLEKQQTIMEQQKDTITRQGSVINKMERQLSRALVAYACQVTPRRFTYMWKIEDMDGCLKKAEQGFGMFVHSERIYIGHPGYQVRLGLKLYEGVVYVYVYLLNGDYDDMLQWPFCHRFSVSLVELQPPVRKNKVGSPRAPRKNCLNQPGDWYSIQLLPSLDLLKSFIKHNRSFVRFSVLL